MKLLKRQEKPRQKQNRYHVCPNLACPKVALGPGPDDRAYTPSLKLFPNMQAAHIVYYTGGIRNVSY